MAGVAERSGLVVMYHYVRHDGTSFPAGIRPILTSEFERQLDWIEARFRIVGADEFLDRVAQPQMNEKPPCLLTFDDGTRDHAEVVTPILVQRGLPGLFFVLTWPAELHRMPLTHAIHWLLGHDDAALWRHFEEYARSKLGGVDALGKESEALRIYHYESPMRARVKYATNMALPAEATETILESAISGRGVTMGQLAEEWFVSPDHIRDMDARGMTIAMHGCSHRSLQVLGAAGIREELHHASSFLWQLTGKRPTWFACPFGGSGADRSVLEAMAKAMDDVGVRGAVTTKMSLVPSGCDPRAIPRYDAIDLPPRKDERHLGWND